MKWIGWGLSIVMAIVCAIVYHAGRQEAIADRTEAEAAVQRQRDTVDAALEAAGGGIPAKQERLAAEQDKVAALERQLADLKARKIDLNDRLDRLAAANEALLDRTAEANDQHEDREAAIRDTQAKLATLEEQIVLLRQAVRRVTPFTEL